MKTSEKIIIGILIAVLLLLVFVAFGKSNDKPYPNPVLPETWPAGCNPNNPGYDMQGNKSDVCVKIYCALNPGDVGMCNASSDCYNGCSSSRPGYDCFGNKSKNC